MAEVLDDAWLQRYWWRILGVLLGVSALLHLTSLSQPREVVFDEVHFGKFVAAYCCTHERFFDIHPPHAKLIIAGVAALAGFEGNFLFEHIGQPYGQQPIAALRLFPAVVGTLLPLLVVILLRQLGASRLISLVGGVVVLLDNAFTLQTRIIALDGLLLIATFGSLSVYLASKGRSGRLGWALVVAAGALAGLAAGTKFTGLAALALLGVLTFVWLWQGSAKERVQWVLRGAVVVVSALVVYAAGWMLHYQLLYLPGSGDAWYVPTGNFLTDTLTWHEKMLSANYNLQATHPDSSPWWSWPAMGQSVFYWQKTDASGHNAFLYFLGNPAVWWGNSALFVAALVAGIVQFGRRGNEGAVVRRWIPLAGFFIAMLPLVRVPRALFLYHYLTPLLFSLLFGLLWADTALPRQLSARRNIILAALTVVVIGFVWFSPLTFGIPVTPALEPYLFWFPGWR